MNMRTESFLARFEPKDKALLEKAARLENLSMADIVVQAVREYAANRKITVEKAGRRWK